MPNEETQVVGGEVTTVEPVGGMDMDAALNDIAEGLSLLPEDEEPPAAPKEPEPPAEPAEAAAPVAPDPADVPPSTWRKEAKEAWATVPATVKEELRKREADIQAYVERSKQPSAVGDKLTSIITPYLPMFEATKTDPWENISAMFRVQERLLYGSPEEKLTIVQALASQAGIKFENGQLSAPPDATAQYVKRLEDRLVQLEGGVKQVTSTVHDARFAELQENVSKFAQDKEAHPFFDEVVDRITHLIQTGAVSSLEEAYQTAVLADPITRQKFVQSEATRVAKAEAKAAKERADAARKTSKANVRSTSRSGTGQPLGTVDDTLKETLAAIHSR